MKSKKLAEHLEKILFPHSIIGIGGILLLNYLNWRLVDVLTFMLPLITAIVLLIILRNKVKNERNLFLLSAGPGLPLFAMLSIFLDPSVEVLFGGVSIFLLLAIGYLIRLDWKVSGHTGAATVVSMVLVLLDTVFLPFFILVPIVGWSRLELEVHTFAQVIVAFLLGVIVPGIVYWVLV